jgi:hypothetical protein
MVTTQGNSLGSYLYLKLAKHHVFCFIYYVFPSTKLENGGTLGTSEKGKVVEKGLGE